MKRILAAFLLLALVSALAAGPVLAQDGGALDKNLIDACVAEGSYDPDVDYFPDKAAFDYAEGVEVAYFNNYKVVRVLQPYPGAEDPLEYVLVQCGTPAPDAEDFAEDVQFIEVPAGDIIAMSTTQLPHLKELDLLDHLIGLDSFLYANTPEVLEMIEAEALVEVGSGAEVNIETVLEAEPSIVMANGFSPDDAPSVLMDAGVFTAVNNEWLEATLLARTEWIKFTAMFYNTEDRANEAFDSIIEDYEAVAALAAEVPDDERVTVLWNTYTAWSEAWIIPGQQTWAGALLADAGVNYVLMDDAPDQSLPLDFEAVYAAGLDAPFWILNTFGVATLDDLFAQDARYEDFAAAQEGGVYNNTGRVNANGGNDFYETGVTNPQIVLRDLVRIFYPDLLPDHELVFFAQLEAAE